MNDPGTDWRAAWERYRPYILNDMTFTFIVMVIMFAVAAIFVF